MNRFIMLRDALDRGVYYGYCSIIYEYGFCRFANSDWDCSYEVIYGDSRTGIRWNEADDGTISYTIYWGEYRYFCVGVGYQRADMFGLILRMLKKSERRTDA